MLGVDEGIKGSGIEKAEGEGGFLEGELFVVGLLDDLGCFVIAEVGVEGGS